MGDNTEKQGMLRGLKKEEHSHRRRGNSFTKALSLTKRVVTVTIVTAIASIMAMTPLQVCLKEVVILIKELSVNFSTDKFAVF